MKNLKKTLKKFRKVRLSLSMKIISLLSCIALVSMGFASWWIIKIDTGTTMGSFVTYQVEEKNIHIDGFSALIDADSHPDIVFGAPAGSVNGWLQVHNETKVEAMSFTYTYDLWAEGEDVRALVDSVVLTLTPTQTVAANLQKAVARGYIKNPTVSGSIGSANATPGTFDGTDIEVTFDITDQSTTKSVTKDTGSETAVQVSVTVTFEWGAAFGNSNPYTYFNTLTSTATPDNTTYAKDYSSNASGVACATNADFAIAALTDLNALLGNQTDAYAITYAINLVQH